MLAHPYFNDITIDTYKKNIFLTFMLSYGAYITSWLSWVNVEVKANIHCQLYTRKTPLHKKITNNSQYVCYYLWGYFYNFSPGIYMADISNIV